MQSRQCDVTGCWSSQEHGDDVTGRDTFEKPGGPLALVSGLFEPTTELHVELEGEKIW